MKGRRITQSFLLILALLMACGPVTAFASDSNTVDFSQKGVISVTLKTEDTAVSGAELTAYRVADAESKDSNLTFTFTEPFADFGGTPEELQSAEDSERLAEYVKENGISGTKAVTDSSGCAVFEDLPLGLYLVAQTKSAEGFSDCSPFLVSLPIEEDGVWVYEADATPKTDVEQLVDITVKKVWNDGNDPSSRPDSVTVNLYRDSVLLDTVILNSENNWSYTWQALPKSDGYSVEEESVSGYAASYSQSGSVFTVTNTPKLVQTGQLNWPIPVLAVCGVGLFAVGWGLVFLKRKKDA